MGQELLDIYEGFFGADVAIAPEYILMTLLIAYVIYRVTRARQGAAKGFWSWAMPARIWRSKSTLIDVELFAIGRIMVMLGIFGRISLISITALLVAPLADGLMGPMEGGARVGPWMLALLLWLIADFSSYWVHRIFHQTPLIWPLHAVHHSAEVLTPITAYRQHPLALVVSLVANTAIIGLLQGLLVGTLAPETSMVTLAGVNGFTVLANTTIANFHHTHLWIGFPRWLERLVISPAQHQIHHSTAPRHYNRNYGQVLALWDWLFGTVMYSAGEVQPQFGLTAKVNAPLQRQRLWPMLWSPVARMIRPSRAKNSDSA